MMFLRFSFRLALFQALLAAGLAYHPFSVSAQENAAGPSLEETRNPAYPLYRRDQPMRFHLAWYSSATFANYWIAAQGMITRDTPKQFLEFLRQDPAYLRAVKNANPREKEPSSIYLHSCGGDEEAAMQLRRLMARKRFSITIAQTFPFRELDDEDTSDSSAILGECRGACILAAWGPSVVWRNRAGFTLEEYYEKLKEDDDGNGRFVKNGNRYMPLLLTPFQTPLPKIQKYAREMKVDPQWLARLLPTRPDENRKLAFWEAARLGLRLEIIRPDEDMPPPAEIQPCPD